jgi:hypothetical protein
MFSSVLFRKLFLAVFLALSGLSAALIGLGILDIRQAERKAASSFGGLIADSLFDRIHARYDRLRPSASRMPSEKLASLLTGFKLPATGRLYLIDEKGISAAHPPGDADHAAIREILAHCTQRAETSVEATVVPAALAVEARAEGCRRFPCSAARGGRAGTGRWPEALCGPGIPPCASWP